MPPPLGKIDVLGPAADGFISYNTVRTMKPGHLRYGIMPTEAGISFDDGMLVRLGPNHFVASCSCSHVDSVRMHLEAWPQDGDNPDRIFVHDATQQWATVSVTGPKAREILRGLGLDLGAEACPQMCLRAASWQGDGLRLGRVSFSDDLSYELSIRAFCADALWAALTDAGVRPSGFVMIGKDRDGEIMPYDLGFFRAARAEDACLSRGS